MDWSAHACIHMSMVHVHARPGHMRVHVRIYEIMIIKEIMLRIINEVFIIPQHIDCRWPVDRPPRVKRGTQIPHEIL